MNDFETENKFDEKMMDEFLKGLSKLTRRYKIAIGGCGCCDSPFLYKTKGEGRYKVDKNHNNLIYE